jgi:hypothetical protein
VKFLTLVIALLVSWQTSLQAQPKSRHAIIIKFKTMSALNAPSNQLQLAIAGISPLKIEEATRIFRKVVNGNIQSVHEMDQELSRIIILPIDSLADEYESANKISVFTEEIEYAEPNYIYHIDAAPSANDSLYGEQWSHRVMHVPEAWQFTQGDTSIHIGFIDTGVEWDHPDLVGQFGVNPAEDINHNGLFDAWPSTEKRLDAHGNLVFGDLDGIDNDGNGYVDDVIGYNFVDQSSINFGTFSGRSPFPVDEEPHNHGTAVAGVIAASANNQIGIAGIAPKCRLVALRAFDETGNAEDDDIASAIVYAADNNVKILNLSFGDIVPSLLQRDAIRYATKKGVLIFASSGNDGSTNPHYPSDFDECVSVGGTILASDNVSESEVVTSTHGHGMDLMAPSEHIITLFGSASYQFIQGTSFSSPEAAAVAGLILSHNPKLSNLEIRSILETTCTNLDPFGYGAFEANGRIDAFKALTYPGSAAIKITTPNTNDGFHVGDSVKIRGYAASTLFGSYALYYSRDRWNRNNSPTLADSGTIISSDKQVINDVLGVWNTNGLRSESYTIQLSVTSNDQRGTVENIGIHFLRKFPKIDSVTATPIYVNEKRGLLVLAHTDTLTTATLYFRKQGASAWLTKKDDRFTKGHNILLTTDDVPAATTLEMKFVAVNSAGDSVSQSLNGTILAESVNQQGFVQKNYSLPLGFALDTVLSTADGNMIVENTFPDGTDFGPLKIFSFDTKAQQFKISDSLNDPWIPRTIGNTTGDSKPELLLQSGGGSYVIYKQNATHSLLGDIINQNAATKAPLAVGLADIDNDGKQELIVEDTGLTSDNFIQQEFKVFRVNGKLTSLVGTLTDTTPPAPGYAQNKFDEPDVQFAKITGNGKIDILAVDGDADIIAWEFNSASKNNFNTLFQDVNDGATEGRMFTTGDFNGDGKTDIAVAFHTGSDPSSQIPNADNEWDASYWTVKVLLGNGDGTFKNIYSDRFYLARSLVPYRSSVGAIHNVTGKSVDDLVLSLFPNFYLLEYDAVANTMKPVWHYPLSNSPRGALAFDFDGNGKREFGFNAGDSLHFFEREDNFADRTLAPSGLETIPRDTNRADLNWGKVPGATEYYILRADTTQGAFLVFIDSTSNLFYSDTNVTNNANYFYAIQSVDYSKKNAVSKASYSVFAHIHPMPKIRTIASHERNISISTSQPLSTAAIDGSVIMIDDSILCSTAIIASSNAIVATASRDLSAGSHRLTVHSFALRDEWNSPFDTSQRMSWTPQTDPIAKDFYIVRWRFEGNTRIYVEFNLRPDDNALDVSHYSLSPFGKISSVSRDISNANALDLTLAPGTIISALGTPFVLCIKDITAEGSVPLDATEGNCAGETLTEPDLENVMVYPNPAKETDGELTFARLTAEAEIYIYTLDMRFLARLKTTDKNGGVKWDMHDEAGKALPSGIYWYHVTGKDDNGNSVKPKEAKFVLIRNK